ncbi:hypothetical protein TUBRATIS_19990 [Tubulinosema ratisbonensis]|uniref:Uncharacterized protein n=1 Tax=Tubulinosema ratisbonensis TaxID=291195 RepID=A0A437AKD7_9MICR|nr:hypothetical protein TUBRATIS_19990 [Tubulinosema ratisbonensis]
MENKELQKVFEIDVNAQLSDGTTTFTELDQETISKTSDFRKMLEKITNSDDFKIKWDAFDADGSITWLLEKLVNSSLTRRIFSKVFLYYLHNQKRFKLILFSIFILCSLLLSFNLFGYYRQFYLFEIFSLGCVSIVCKFIQLVVIYFYDFKYDLISDLSVILCYFIYLLCLLIRKFYYEKIIFDWIIQIFIFLNTSFVLLFNFLMSYKLFKYLKYILPLLFFTTLLFFSLFYRFKYFLIAYIISMILCTLCNFLLRLFYERRPSFSDILQGGIFLFYVYNFELLVKSEIINTN